jgi:protein phosphatase
MTRTQVDFAWRTDRGRVRARNEDSVAVHEKVGVAVIADGIGGASSGNLASRIAVNAIYQRFVRQPPSRVDPGPASQLAVAAVEDANAAILEYVRQSPDCAGMGTTVVIGYFGNTWLVHAHVGDSRLYRLRDGHLVQLTRDHSFIQEVVDQGFFPSLSEAVRYGINQHVLTRAVGSAASHVVAETAVAPLAAGDLYLFCTDGLSGMVPDDELQSRLSAIQGDLGLAAESLVHRACAKGGVDNITLVLARVRASDDSEGDA